MVKSELYATLAQCDGWLLPAAEQRMLKDDLDKFLVSIFYKANDAAREVSTGLVLKSCTMHSMLKKHVQPHTSDEVLVLDTEKTEAKVMGEYGKYTREHLQDRLLLYWSDIDGCLLEWDKGLPFSLKPSRGCPTKGGVGDEEVGVWLASIEAPWLVLRGVVGINCWQDWWIINAKNWSRLQGIRAQERKE
jgi:hypothetical protein